MNWVTDRLLHYNGTINVISTVLLIGLISGCAVRHARISTPTGITIRVGITEHQPSVKFTAVDKLVVRLEDGTFVTAGNAGDRFTASVRNGQSARMKYGLLIAIVSSLEQANRKARQLLAQGFATSIRHDLRLQVINGQLVRQPVHLIFLEPGFDTVEQARAAQQQLPIALKTKIRAFLDTLPTGSVILRNERTGRKIETRGYMQIARGRIQMEVPTGTGFHYENTVRRSYEPVINLVVDEKAAITVVNVLPLPAYLSSVVASEMNAAFPIEALKAQAVCARSFTLSKIARQHPMKPFDLCDDVHCQVFSGIDRITDSIREAVRTTSGQVLIYNGSVCETYYHGICGGHTADNETIWSGDARPYLRGRFDVPTSLSSIPKDFLLNEANLTRWINETPRVFCNVTGNDAPDAVQYLQKYFRWHLTLSQMEVRKQVHRTTGQDPGTITNIRILERGLSGRIRKLCVKGTTGTIIIEHDLPVRKALRQPPLYSSCFIITPVNIRDGVPAQFDIYGAGWGHGVGMCQAGAAMMARNGAGFRDILSHYYQQTILRKIY